MEHRTGGHRTAQLPFPVKGIDVKGIDSDNDSVFINETLINETLTQYCAKRGIEFIRSRPYRKNDQAWVEQKNGAVVRHFVGHDRYSGAVAGPTMAHRYWAVRQYVNYFQPPFKLVEKTRHGSRAVGIDPRRPVTVRRHLQDHGRVPEQWEVGKPFLRWNCCKPCRRRLHYPDQPVTAAQCLQAALALERFSYGDTGFDTARDHARHHLTIDRFENQPHIQELRNQVRAQESLAAA